MQEIFLAQKKFYYYGEAKEKDYTALFLPDAPEFKRYPVPVGDRLMIESEGSTSR